MPAPRIAADTANPESPAERKREHMVQTPAELRASALLHMMNGWTSYAAELQNARHAPRTPATAGPIVDDRARDLMPTVTPSILQRIAAGDRDAVNECLDTYGDLVWSLARRFNSGHADAEDAVQDIFIDVWTHAGRFDPSKASETTFVATIARRRLIDRLRKQGRRPFHDDIDETVLPQELEQSVKPETGVELDIVSRALATLRPEQQKVLQLSVVEGHSHSAVADLLDMPLGTVKTHVRRGLIRIREELEMLETGEEAGT